MSSASCARNPRISSKKLRSVKRPSGITISEVFRPPTTTYDPIARNRAMKTAAYM
jgi:hypothetical protein